MATAIDPRRKRAAETRAYRLVDACETEVNAAGGRVIYDADLLDPDLYGCVIPDRGGKRTIIVSDAYDDLTSEAFFVAHETAHFFDPALIRFGYRFPSQFDQDCGEAVAHYASKIMIAWFGMTEDVRVNWIDNRILEHSERHKYFRQSRALYRRPDAAASAVLPQEGRQWLWNERRRAGHRPEEIPLSERVAKRAQKWFGT